MRHETVHLIAQTLCECDGKDWLAIEPSLRDRYVRIAILIDHRIGDPGPQDPKAQAGGSAEPVPDPRSSP